ncbi:CD9 antigen [Brachionus plicatilis]|uniref:Tetraspanin n=1 Tax=Brachionus plicatilis TaxID=10195 RepID=A0A3M7S5P2_BRAPC|nr:CD9 antigen [Brachionus plicatilis]
MIPRYTERELKQKVNFLIGFKQLMFGANMFIWAAGCTAACIGIWFRVERDFRTLVQRLEEAEISFSSDYILVGANLLISIGAIIAFVGLLGSISVSKENEKLLFLYSVLMFAVFGIYFACATWGFVKLDYLKGIVSDAMRELFNKAMLENDNTAKYAVNEIQKQLQCCGNVGPSEYAGDIPPTCSSYIIGCNQAFYDFFWRNLLLISLIGLVFGFFQLIVIICGAYFANEVRRARKFEKLCRQYMEESKQLLNKH